MNNYTTNYVATAPSNATILYVCNSGWNADTGIVILQTDKSIIGYNIQDFPFNTTLMTEINKLGCSVVNELEGEVFGTYPNHVLSVGDINITSSGWLFSNSTSRARTNIDDLYILNAGDVIHLSDYDSVRMYIGYRDSDDNYYYAGWLQKDFMIPFDCECVILLSYVTERNISSANELSRYLYVYHKETLFSDVQRTRSKNINVKSINHQGFNYIAPNQTIPSYKLSKLFGFDYVECDVLKTSDGEYVLNHDDNIATTGIFYDITGDVPTLVTEETLISQTTYDTLISNYEMRKSLHDDYSGTKIAKFDDFILLCKNLGLHPYIELKSGGSSDTLALFNIVKSMGMMDKVTWISVTHNYLSQIRSYYTNARIGLIVNTITAESITNLQNISGTGEKFIDANYSNLTDELISDCINSGFPLETWIINDADTIETLHPYITGVTSNSLVAGKVLYDANIT